MNLDDLFHIPEDHFILVSDIKFSLVSKTGSYCHVEHLGHQNVQPVDDGFLFGDDETAQEAQVIKVPIHDFSRNIQITSRVSYRQNTYIAITPEIQSLLCMPVDTLKTELEQYCSLYEAANIRNAKITGAGFWQRLKFLFSRKI